MNSRELSIIAGISYIVIFFAAIFANFFMLESLTQDPVGTVEQNSIMVRIGILAFLLTVLFDVVVAWALYEMYKKNPINRLSTYFRLMHAVIMGVAIFALPLTLSSSTGSEILMYVNIFNIIWLIGLFFFGFHLILLGKIIKRPRLIGLFLIIAGIMYVLDTIAHFVLPNYQIYSGIFLMLVAIPSILGEMSFAIWLLFKGGKS